MKSRLTCDDRELINDYLTPARVRSSRGIIEVGRWDGIVSKRRGTAWGQPKGYQKEQDVAKRCLRERRK
jgi:hypothetical protein